MSVVEPAYDSGRVWRFARKLTVDEIKDRIQKLPQVFGEVDVYFKVEVYRAVRESGAFRFLLSEYRPAGS